MNGRAVYNFAVKAVTETIEQLLADEASAWTSWPVSCPTRPTRASFRPRRSGWASRGKVLPNIEEYANTSAASIPIALDELVRAGALKRGDYVMTVGFGAGLT
jgi:3-oxoacyl-[acyl-carrier-protein] synthase-3